MLNLFSCYSCFVECSSPLGLQNRSIPDCALTASSASRHWPANQARLNNSGAWVPLSNRGAWFQVEFSNMTNITAIATQGHPDYDYWVKSYSVYHSNDGHKFQPYHQQVANYNLLFEVFHSAIFSSYFRLSKFFLIILV